MAGKAPQDTAFFLCLVVFHQFLFFNLEEHEKSIRRWVSGRQKRYSISQSEVSNRRRNEFCSTLYNTYCLIIFTTRGRTCLKAVPGPTSATTTKIKKLDRLLVVDWKMCWLIHPAPKVVLTYCTSIDTSLSSLWGGKSWDSDRGLLMHGLRSCECY